MRAFLRVVLFPTVVLTVVFSSMSLDARFGWRCVRIAWLGGPLALFGLALIVWCNALFLQLGEGTAHPFAAKTKRMVIAGPYRCVRNPMMWGVVSLLIGLALWLGSAGLWVAVAIFLTFISLFVPLYEEKDMERRFGEEYREYCRTVPRWWPKFPVGRRKRR